MGQLKIVGLSPRAREIAGAEVTVNEMGLRRYPDGRQVSFDREVSVKRFEATVVGTHKLPCGGEVELSRYTAADGTVVEEFVQTVVTNCDTHVFLALNDAGGYAMDGTRWLDWEVALHSRCYCRYTC